MFPISENTIFTPMATTDAALTAEIPVVFFDGEREIDLGKAEVYPTMTFKIFQTLLSSKIGISPHQITIYFERNNNNNHQRHRRRHPVTNKFDFRALVADNDLVSGSCFWVVLKRARRNRRRRNNTSNGGMIVNNNGNVKNGGLDDGFVLLRREVNDWVYMENINRMRMMIELERQRENYLMSLNLNSNVYNELSGLNPNDFHDYGGGDYNDKSMLSRSSDDYDNYDDGSCSTGGASSDRMFCDVCYNYPGETVPFHWCKNDAVAMGFRSSPAGPIAPPSKS